MNYFELYPLFAVLLNLMTYRSYAQVTLACNTPILQGRIKGGGGVLGRTRFLSGILDPLPIQWVASLYYLEISIFSDEP